MSALGEKRTLVFNNSPENLNGLSRSAFVNLGGLIGHTMAER